MPRPKIKKTTMTFTVLHRADAFPLPDDEFWGEYDGPYAGPLGFLMQEAWDGGMVGIESDGVTVDVPDDQVETELIAMGNDGTFFEEDDDV
jgi:hypothetical protein